MTVPELSILSALDTLVLERDDGKYFHARGALPTWCTSIVPEDAARCDETFLVTDVFPFFEWFLPQAEDVWRHDGSRRIDSPGFTQILSSGRELHLVGTALRIDHTALLLVAVNERLFREERALLQRARELRFAHDALAREMEQKEILAHCVVHDLRNPLGAVLGALSILETKPLEPSDAKLVSLAGRAARRQDELIRDVLATFSAEHGVHGAERSPWSDIGSVVTQIASVLEPMARSRGVTIETVLAKAVAPKTTKRRVHHALVTPTAEGGVEVAADELRLFRVIGNLVENALRYSSPGGVVRIRVDGEGNDILVRIEDRGPGVPAALVPHLFKKFARAGDGTPGTGLGLYFCRITVEAWGGSIGYEPRAGGGSTFWFRLPKRGVSVPLPSSRA